MQIRTEKIIDVQEWDDLVIKTYGRPYSFQQQDGCKDRGMFSFTVPDKAHDYENTTVPEIVNDPERGVSFVAWLARDPNKNLPNMWWERNFYPDVQMIANDLHAKGLIEAGDYNIDINW